MVSSGFIWFHMDKSNIEDWWKPMIPCLGGHEHQCKPAILTITRVLTFLQMAKWQWRSTDQPLSDLGVPTNFEQTLFHHRLYTFCIFLPWCKWNCEVGSSTGFFYWSGIFVGPLDKVIRPLEMAKDSRSL